MIAIRRFDSVDRFTSAAGAFLVAREIGFEPVRDVDAWRFEGSSAVAVTTGPHPVGVSPEPDGIAQEASG